MPVRLASLLLALVHLLASAPVTAADREPVAETVERFVRNKTSASKQEVHITVGAVDLSRLPPCNSHEAFLPPGMRLVGKVHIGVKCLGPSLWSVLVPVQVALIGTYLTTTRPLPAGHILRAEDFAAVSGDLSALPNGIATDAQGAIGKSLRNALGGGQVLLSQQLLAPLIVRQGQTVRVVSQGTGFAITAEGKALNNAAEGELVQVRTPSGQTISGIAKADGSVVISF